MRDLLEKMMKFAGEKVGQKPGDQWRGSDPNPPGKKLVGDSILKDLSKGKTPKTREQELAEEFQAFLEAEFKDTVDKRPARKNARPARGHEPQPRYKTIKADESAMSEKDIELQDYRSMSHKEFQTAYGMTKTEWINKNKALVIQNPSIKKALGLDEAADRVYTVDITRYRTFGDSSTRSTSGTIPELLNYFGYTLEVGKSYEHERGRKKINMNPRTIQQLVDNLNKAASNAARNGAASTYYSVGESAEPVAESHYKWEVTFRNGKKGAYHHNDPYYKDRTAAEDIRYTLKSNPGATVVATKDGEPFDWESVLSEGWESGPEEYEEPYDDADDAYDRMRQEKIDTEAEKEWAKLPKVTTYKLLGRGPKMEPNWDFGGTEYPSQEAAIEARAKLMADPNTPNPRDIGIQTITRVKDQTNENSVTTPKNPEHAKQMMQDLSKLQTDIPNPDPELQATMARRKDILMKQAKELGIDESRAHKVLDTWFKKHEREAKFAKGELTIPTPAERQAQLKKLEKKKPVKEYGANQPTGTAAPGNAINDPKQLQAVAQATNTLKAATQSTAPTTNIAKALDSASQGKPTGQQDMKVLEPLMKDIETIASNPNLANLAKPVFSQAQQLQRKEKQQQQKTT